MEYNYPKFTPEMKKTHTILIPNMAVTQFRHAGNALRYDGYKCEMLGNCGSEVAQLGLKYVHNDTCYPALLVIGQFLDALNSGKYDLDHTALLITQTGGGCRASNYIHLLRKALVKAGYANIPVASLNFSGLEKDSGFQMTLPLVRQCHRRVFYGDMLVRPAQPVPPYENEKGAPTGWWTAGWSDLGRVCDGQGLLLPRDEAHLAAHRRGLRLHPRHPRAEGQGGRRGRDLRQVLPAGQQRSGEVPRKSGLRGQLPGPDGLCAVLHLQHGRGHACTAASWP